MAPIAPIRAARVLPPEILLAVATCCSKSELCILILLNHNFYDILIHEIYTTVTLTSRRAIESFSDALVTGGAHLRALPYSIYICPKQMTTKLLFPLADSIRQALLQATNLRNLTLVLQYKAVKSIFRDITYPFLLTRLACPAISGKEFSRFLHKQTLLEEIEILRGVRAGITVGTTIRNIAPGFLPKLDSISASYENLATLIPGRPVTRVSTGPASLCPDEYDIFASSLSESAVRVDVVDVSLSYLWITTALSGRKGLLKVLANYSVQPRYLSINLVLPEQLHTQNPILWHRYAPVILDGFYESILECLEHLDLSAFRGLETFEITQREGLTAWIKREPPFSIEHSVLDKIKDKCSSLQCLKLFGLILE